MTDHERLRDYHKRWALTSNVSKGQLEDSLTILRLLDEISELKKDQSTYILVHKEVVGLKSELQSERGARERIAQQLKECGRSELKKDIAWEEERQARIAAEMECERLRESIRIIGGLMHLEKNDKKSPYVDSGANCMRLVAIEEKANEALQLSRTPAADVLNEVQSALEYCTKDDLLAVTPENRVDLYSANEWKKQVARVGIEHLRSWLNGEASK